MPRPEDPPRSKRPRAAQACDRCRSKKYKCDELYPCSHCKKSHLDCVYQGNYRQLENSRSASYVQDLEKKIEELSSKLQAVESKLSPCELEPPHLNATPSSMPTDRPTARPTLTPTSRQEPEEPAPYAAGTDTEETSDPVDDEISELNHHTNGIEFHGSTSSVAFLGHLQKARDPQPEVQWRNRPRAQEYFIVSTLHNASFSPTTNAPQSLAAVHEHNYYFEQAHVFMSGYFENIHFIHPFIDKEDFYLRAQDLWMRRSPTPDPGFIALYLSVLSFGALLRVWDEAQLGGLTRFEWSRKLFSEAQMYLNYLHFPNNLDAVQCWYLMAKICQNELNPNLAYMYLGLAVRTSLAAGFNRNVQHSNDPRSEWISKTWWGLYSLEIEMSFSLGRPDTLGLDDYHNRPLPPRNSSQYAIIPWMVDFARITRKVSVQIYHRRLTLTEKLAAALTIEAELDAWVAQLPGWIRPGFIGTDGGTSAGAGFGRNDLKDPKWARRQRLVLGIRYYNVKTLLFRPFLRHSTAVSGGLACKSKPGQKPEKQSDTPDTNPQAETDTTTTSQLSETITKCLNAAQETISVIHDIYRVHTFFRCWWYNTTYVTFATSTLLLPLSLSHSIPSTSRKPALLTPSTNPITNASPNVDTQSIIRSIQKAIEILEATDESVVTRKCAEIIRYYLREFQARHADTSDTGTCERGTGSVGSSGLGGGEEGIGMGMGMGWVGAGAEDGDGFGLTGAGAGAAGGGGGEFDVPDWAYGFGFPDYSFEGIARFFDDLGGLPILDDA